MTPRQRALLRGLILIVVAAGFLFLFPRAVAAAEMAARELRYLWWMVLLLGVAIWLIWGFKKKT